LVCGQTKAGFLFQRALPTREALRAFDFSILSLSTYANGMDYLKALDAGEK
jgi:hypothetical protein